MAKKFLLISFLGLTNIKKTNGNAKNKEKKLGELEK